MDGTPGNDVINLDEYRRERHPARSFRDLLASDLTDASIEEALSGILAAFETGPCTADSRHLLQEVLIALDMTESPIDIPLEPDKFNPENNRNRARHMLSIDRKIAVAARTLNASVNAEEQIERIWHQLVNDEQARQGVLLRAVDYINARIGIDEVVQDMWRLAVLLLKMELKEQNPSSEI